MCIEKKWGIPSQLLAVMALTFSLQGCGGPSDAGSTSGTSSATTGGTGVAGVATTAPVVSGNPPVIVAANSLYSFQPKLINPAGIGQMEALEPGLYAKLNANQTTFAADANASTAVTQLNNLYQKGYFGKSALSSKEADTSKQMASGKYAMTLSEISRGTQIASAFPTFQATDFGYFPDPILDNQLQPVHPAGPTWMIDTKSQHVTEAKEWLDFMMQPDNLQWLIDNTPDFETLPFTGVKAKWDASQQAFFDTYKEASVPVLQDGVNYVNPQWMLMGQDFVSMFTGKATPQKVLQLIDTERTKEAKTAKDPSWP